MCLRGNLSRLLWSEFVQTAVFLSNECGAVLTRPTDGGGGGGVSIGHVNVWSDKGGRRTEWATVRRPKAQCRSACGCAGGAAGAMTEAA